MNYLILIYFVYWEEYNYLSILVKSMEVPWPDPITFMGILLLRESFNTTLAIEIMKREHLTGMAN